MKTNKHHLIPAGFAAALLAPAAAPAIEPPEDDAPPPAALLEKLRKETPAPPAEQAAESPAFLGVVTGPVPELLAAHLHLEAGRGVTVRAVVPDGPAANAGLQTHDVITRINETEVGTPADLTRQIQNHKPGDKISLQLIHEGKPAEIAVVLGERPAEEHSHAPRLRNERMFDGLMLDGMPREQARRLRDLIEGNLGGMDPGDLMGAPVPGAMHEAMERMKRRMDGIMRDGLPEIDGDAGGFQFQSDATIRVMDDQGSLEMRSRNGGKEITIRDQANEITWTGPWDTEQDKAAAPEGVRERVENLNLDEGFAGKGLRFNFRMPGVRGN